MRRRRSVYVRGFGSTARRVKAAGRDLQVLTQLRDRELGLLRVDPSEHYAWCLAKKAVSPKKFSGVVSINPTLWPAVMAAPVKLAAIRIRKKCAAV